MPSTYDERRAAVLAGLARAFGEQALHPDEYHEMNWTEERWTAGCIPIWAPGLLTTCGPGYAGARGTDPLRRHRDLAGMVRHDGRRGALR